MLAPGGRAAITPLYLDDTHFVLHSPVALPPPGSEDPDAVRIWRDDEFSAPYSRHYSPETFAERIASRLPPGLAGHVAFATNLGEVMAAYPGQRIYSFFTFLLEKAFDLARCQRLRSNAIVPGSLPAPTSTNPLLASTRRDAVNDGYVYATIRSIPRSSNPNATSALTASVARPRPLVLVEDRVPERETVGGLADEAAVPDEDPFAVLDEDPVEPCHGRSRRVRGERDEVPQGRVLHERRRPGPRDPGAEGGAERGAVREVAAEEVGGAEDELEPGSPDAQELHEHWSASGAKKGPDLPRKEHASWTEGLTEASGDPLRAGQISAGRAVTH